MSAALRLSGMNDYEIYQFVKSIVFRSANTSFGISQSDSKLLELIADNRAAIYDRASDDALINIASRYEYYDSQTRITNIEPISLMSKSDIEKYLRAVTSPDDYLNSKRDISGYPLGHLMGTGDSELYFATVSGDSMIGASIDETDVLIYRQTAQVANNSIIIAKVNGNVYVKRIKYDSESIYLVSENPKYSPYRITNDVDFKILGEVCGSIRQIAQGFGTKSDNNSNY